MSIMHFNCTVIRWIDGDTVDLNVDLGFSIFSRQRIRLANINTPEKGRHGFAEATAAATEFAPPGTPLVLETTHKDMYGRYIGLLHLADKTTVNQRLLEAGHAVSYKA